MNAYVNLEELDTYLAAHEVKRNTSDGLTAAALRKASLMALTATRGAVYATDKHGVATKPSILQAFKLAVMAQVAYWERAGITGYSGSVNDAAQVNQLIKSKSFGGTTINYENAKSALDAYEETQKVRSMVELVPDALLELETAGLLQARTNTSCYTVGGISFTPDIPAFVTKKQLETAISTIKPADLSGLATKEELEKAVAGIDLAPYLTAEDLPDLSQYATKDEIAALGDTLSDYVQTERDERSAADNAINTELGSLRAAIQGVLDSGATDAELAKAIADLHVAQFETVQHAADTYLRKDATPVGGDPLDVYRNMPAGELQRIVLDLASALDSVHAKDDSQPMIIADNFSEPGIVKKANTFYEQVLARVVRDTYGNPISPQSIRHMTKDAGVMALTNIAFYNIRNGWY